MKRHLLQLLTASLGASLACAQETPAPTPAKPTAPPAAAPGEGRRPLPPDDARPRREPGGPLDDGPGTRRPARDDGPEFDRPGRPNGGPRRGEDEGQIRRGEFGTEERPMLRREGRSPERLQSYLGVITRPAMPDLSAQLRQPEGFGLIVEDLLPESPAFTAGLQRNDFILRFDDQLLINPPQLEALVRRTGKDHDVVLTLLRAGEEKKVTVKIGEKLLPERRPIPGMDRMPANFERELGVRGDDGGRQRPGMRGEFGQGGGVGDGNREIRYAPERARVVRRDDRGSYELSMDNGLPTFAVRKPDGSVAWQGPVKTPEQRQAVPAEWQGKLDDLEAARARFPRNNFQYREGQPRDGQERNSQPRDGQGATPPPPPRSPEPAER